MRKPQPFFAVIVTIRHLSASGHTLYTSVRAYERREMHLGRDAFINYAVGDMLRVSGALSWDGNQYVSENVKIHVHDFENPGDYWHTVETELDTEPGAYAFPASPVQEGRWS